MVRLEDGTESRLSNGWTGRVAGQWIEDERVGNIQSRKVVLGA